MLAALQNGVSLVISDALTDRRVIGPEAASAFQALQIRSVVTVSLIRNGRFVAALYVHDKEPRAWTAEECALIREVAERTWSAVERAYAETSLRALAKRQSFLLNLSDYLRPLASADEIKQMAAQMLGEHLAAGRAGYGEIDASQEHVTVERDWSDGKMSSLGGETRRLEIFGAAIIAELKAGRLLRLDSVADDPVSAPYAEGYASIGTKSLLVVPLLKEDRLVAILYVHESQPRRWTDEEVAIASEVADRTWAAVERARAESALRLMNATLEERVNQSLAERRIYARIVEDTDSPIQMIDRDYRFLAINPAARADYERVFGVRPRTGQSLLDLLAMFLSKEMEQERSGIGRSPVNPSTRPVGGATAMPSGAPMRCVFVRSLATMVRSAPPISSVATSRSFSTSRNAFRLSKISSDKRRSWRRSGN